MKRLIHSLITSRAWKSSSCKSSLQKKVSLLQEKREISTQKEEKPILKKTCPQCGIEFETKNPDQIYCTIKHQKAAWVKQDRAKKKQDGILPEK